MHISFFSTVKGLSLAQNAWLEALQATLTWRSNRRASIPVYINTECIQIVHPVHSAQYIRSVCFSTEIHCMVVFQRSPAWLCQDTVFAHIPSLILAILTILMALNLSLIPVKPSRTPSSPAKLMTDQILYIHIPVSIQTTFI